jgi:predicted Zn finger-like uncharacterized protein
MKVSCPSCDSKYSIADDKVVGKKIKVRCKTCGTQILVDGTLPQATVTEEGGDHASHTADSSGQPGSSQPSNPGVGHSDADSWTVNLSETEERTMTTQQVVDAALRNELGIDVFVWKDGMDDWALWTDVPELKAAIDAAKHALPDGAGPVKSAAPGKLAAKATASNHTAGATTRESVKPPAADDAGEKRGPIVAAPGSALAKKIASAKAAATMPKAEPAPEQPKEIRPEPAKKAATRLGAKRAHSTHDLFAAVDQAGSEIDVDTSEAEEHGPIKATGARNENSVLFSLDALRSGALGGTSKGAAPAATPGKKAPPPPTKKLEDLMTIDRAHMGPIGGGGLLLSGNEALYTAPAPPPPKPEPKPVPVAAAVSAGDVFVPPRRNKLGLVIGIVAGVLVVGTVGAVVALKVIAPTQPVASGDTSAKAASSAPAESARIAASAVAAPGPSETSAPDAAAPSAAASAAPVAVAAAGKVGGSSGSSKGASEPKTEKKPDKPEPAQPAVSGSFSKDAAVAALSVAASQATVCKKPEGPWGTGQALVTFAPSGRVTTANVTGAPFGGTPVGGCVANVFRRARIPAFSGDPVTVSKRFTISP